MSRHHDFRLFSFAAIVVASAFVSAGCVEQKEEVVGATVLSPAHILGNSTDKLPGDEQVVDARLVVHPNGRIGAVVDEVERYPIWPYDTTIEEVDFDTKTYRITIPQGPTIDTSPGSPALIQDTAIIDTDQTLFGTHPNREAFADPSGDGWQPTSVQISYCKLQDVGPIAFSNPAKIEIIH